MEQNLFIGLIVCIFFVSCTVLLEKENKSVPDAIAKDPVNATYKIDGKKITLTEGRSEILAKGYATANSAWMTEMFVPFESVIEFKAQNSGSRGTLILHKDNPTDRSEFDNELKIPIFFN